MNQLVMGSTPAGVKKIGNSLSSKAAYYPTLIRHCKCGIYRVGRIEDLYCVKMECNKEAVRTKEVAVQKLMEKDISGAKKFALKAQNLFPKLDGLSQFIEIIDVHVAHEKKINGEADYYGVLGVDPFADEEVLKKQYRKLALSLHPDKNKSFGADRAFKILSQAWSVLSDINQRSAYNSKLNIRASDQTAVTFSSSTAANPQCFPTQPRTQGTSTGQHYTSNQHPPSKNPHPIATNQRTSRPPFEQYHYVPLRHQWMTFSPPLSRPETFWTWCVRCKTLYEYHKMHLNQNLLCHCCQQSFLATEVPAPKVSNHTSSRPRHQKQPSDECLKRTRCKEIVNMTRDNGNPLKDGSSIAEEMMKAASASNALSGINREKPVKKRRKNSMKCDGNGDETSPSGRKSGVKKVSAKLNGHCGAKRESRSGKDFSQAEIHAMLVRKAKMGILVLLNEWEAEQSKCLHMKGVEIKKDAVVVNHVETEKSKDGLFRDPKNTLQPKKSSSLLEADEVDTTADEAVSMMVPDANFHIFDEDRIEVSFSENQVWAAYDDDDGMPRYYALVHNVISRNPFKMQISWLNSKSSSEFGSLDWIGSGFTKTCGDFRVGKCEVSKRLNSFSHSVKWKKGPKGAIQIFPTKGDVWAVYRNWSPDWVDQEPTDESIHEYAVVVVLEDYNEDAVGVTVARLLKVAGFTSVFNLDQRGARTIPREEMFRFSHQVPFHILNGLEAENSPVGCYELDPAALPLDLLNVITDAEASVAVSEAMVEPTQKTSCVDDSKSILTYSRRKKRKENGKGC
ncbi:hypothetical protein OROHE_000095 [Orobanche hederae]